MTDEPSLGSLKQRLERLDAPIRIWREARERSFWAAFGTKGGKPSPLMGRLPQAAGAAAAIGPGPRDLVFAVFDEICDLYSRSDPPRYAIIRGIVHEREARVFSRSTSATRRSSSSRVAGPNGSSGASRPRRSTISGTTTGTGSCRSVICT
jgi:hypothetical protein